MCNTEEQLKPAMKENKFNRLKPNRDNFFLIVYSKTIPCFQIFAHLILAKGRRIPGAPAKT